MRKSNGQGVSYSIVPVGAFRQLFLNAIPPEKFVCSGDDTQGHGQTVPDYPKQIRAAVESCFAILKAEQFDRGVMMTTFFLADIGKKELVRQIASEIFGGGAGSLGSMTFVPQAPADGSALAVEIWAIADSEATKVKLHRETPIPGRVTTAEMNDVRWFFAGDARPGDLPIGSYARSLSAFERLGESLKENRFPVSQILRTWIYQGHLVLPEGKTQRYKELNRARTDFFHGVEFLKWNLPDVYQGAVYPASTGIGADDVDVVIGATAFETDRNDFIAVPLENPNQTSAFDYGASYSPQSPKFARAMAVSVDSGALIFVSGTASITESESRHIEDPEKQTELTLDNIAALIDGKNLERHGITGFDSDLSKLELVRVYVKRPNELEIIRKVCKARLGDTPTLFTIADVCRPELLVEIEGIAVPKKK